MKFRRLVCLLCAAALFSALAMPAGALSYVDLPKTHWAYDYLDKAAQLGILLGMGDGRMEPDGTLTWAQCLTIAARTFAPQAYAKAKAEETDWRLTGYRACLEAGFLLPGSREFLPVSEDGDALSAPISRQDTAVVLARAIPQKAAGQQWDYRDGARITLTAEGTFTDFADVPESHRSSVSRLYDLGIVKGSPATDEAGNTTYRFDGGAILRRCDGAAMFLRGLDKADSLRYGEKKTVTIHVVNPQGTALTDLTAETAVGRAVQPLADSLVDQVEGLRYFTQADDRYFSVSTAADEYTVTYRPMTDAERQRTDFYDAVDRGELSIDDYWWQPFNRYVTWENDYKHLILFGDRDTRRYASKEEAAAHMATVTIPVWKLDKKGAKYESKASIQINAAIADDVVAMFTEIFEDPEQFPIKSIGGFRWVEGASGEHNCGTAVDINPTENFQIRDGKALVGTHWTPGEDPYSIPLGGSVARIMDKYGWTWGNGEAWSTGHADPATGYHDYMHFSYMGG